jgi:hypothetical protein
VPFLGLYKLDTHGARETNYIQSDVFFHPNPGKINSVVGIDIVLRAQTSGCNKNKFASGKQIIMNQAIKNSFIVRRAETMEKSEKE